MVAGLDMATDDHSDARGLPGAESFLRLLRRGRRGRLKVYLGYAPGVGTTYQMLLEGHRLRDQGVDVVIGHVESHTPPDTRSLCLGLEAAPRRVVGYRGIRIEEMDLDAVLARAPEVALIDELAHANAPGGRHAKRWQDVLEVLEAGISVVTTVSVHHLESLFDTVGHLVGVTVKDRVPDWVVAEADQVVNVDLTVEDLLQRLAAGRVYPADRVPAALASFFRKENLEQLRELTLREAAAQAQRPGGSRREGPALFAPDQVMVCLSSQGPASDALLRYGSRLAGKLDRNWFAVYVQTPGEAPERLAATTRRRIDATLGLAQTLGATVFTYRGDSVVGTILRFAREYGVGHVVVGRPGSRRWRDRLLGRRGPVQDLMERAEGLTVVVVDPEARPVVVGPGAAPTARQRKTTPPPPQDLMEAADLLCPEAVLILAGCPSKEELIERLLERLARLHPHLDGGMALRRLMRRESEGSTFLETGLGLPHARIPGLSSPLAALALCPAGSPGDPRVTLLLLLPEDDPGQALRILGGVARVFRRPESIERLAEAVAGEEAVETWRSLVARAGATVPPGQPEELRAVGGAQPAPHPDRVGSARLPHEA